MSLRPLAPRCAAGLLAAFVTALLPSVAAASAAEIPDGLGVVIDTATMARTATIAAGEVLTLHVVVDTEPAPGGGPPVRAYQFGLEIDPRLVVTGTTFPPQVIFPNQPTPHDFILGLGDCITLDARTVLLTASVLLPPGQTGATDLRIDVRPLLDGQPMLYLMCQNQGDLRRFRPAGGVVLNPSAPTIVRLAGSPPVLVEGRTLRLAWETFGTDPEGVLLNGAPIDATGSLSLQPTSSTTWMLHATAVPLSVNATFSADVIRRPRVDQFTAEPFLLGTDPAARLSWDVQGANTVSVTGVGDVTPLSGALVPVDRETWVLQATNEWGSTVVGAQLNLTEQPPVIVQFVATPADPIPGEDITLQWTVLGADAVTITPQPGGVDPAAGSATVHPTETTTYTLSATNAYGTTQAMLQVQLAPPVIAWFTATPTSFHAGQTVVLAWAATHGGSATITPDIGAVSPSGGSLAVQPERSTVYTFTVANALGSAQATVPVGLLPPGIGAFTATPSAIFAGQSTTLRWTVGEGLDLRIDPGVGPVHGTTGSVLVTPTTSPTVYTLTASNVEGSVTATALVTWFLPTASFTVDVASPYAVDAVHLTANISGATSASIAPLVGSIPPTGGTFSVVVPQPTTFTLTATNPAGSITRQVVVVPRKPSVSLHASTTSPWPDEDMTLTATIVGAASAHLEPGFGEIALAGGTFVTRVPQVTTYVLTAENTMGAVSSQVTITPRAPVITTFRVNPTQVIPGQPATLNWNTQHASEVSIEPGGFTGLSPVGSLVVTATGTTTYTLTAANTAGAVTATVLLERLPFSIVSFTATPGTILAGSEATLAWQVEGEADVSIDGLGPLPMSGSLAVRPDMTTTYFLRATNGALQRSASLQVRVVTQPAQSGFLVLSWDRDGAWTSPRQILAFAPFDFYAVALEAEGGIEAWELSIHSPPGMLVAGGRMLATGSTDFGSGDDNFIVGTGGICIQDPAVPLVRYSTCLFLATPPNDTIISLGGGQPTSFASGLPGYLMCTPGELREFVVGEPLVINGTNQPPPLTAAAVTLRVEVRPDGNLVAWTVSGAAAPSTVELRRHEPGAPDATLASFEGAQARAGTWVDATAVSGTEYRYSAVARVDGTAVTSPEVAATRELPVAGQGPARLLANVPNPFNPRTEIRFQLGAPSAVRLVIVDAAGRRVRAVELPGMSSGLHAWTWTGDDDSGRMVGSGVYRVQLAAGAHRDVRSVTLVR